ncbi:unnamed protein product [Amoebophrya sp. A25]|nr:unnamed protein product [Amoebophrya sp. A25]|eukprot:GSA25T00011464001.1
MRAFGGGTVGAQSLWTGTSTSSTLSRRSFYSSTSTTSKCSSCCAGDLRSRWRTRLKIPSSTFGGCETMRVLFSARSDGAAGISGLFDRYRSHMKKIKSRIRTSTTSRASRSTKKLEEFLYGAHFSDPPSIWARSNSFFGLSSHLAEGTRSSRGPLVSFFPRFGTTSFHHVCEYSRLSFLRTARSREMQQTLLLSRFFSSSSSTSSHSSTASNSTRLNNTVSYIRYIPVNFATTNAASQVDASSSGTSPTRNFHTYVSPVRLKVADTPEQEPSSAESAAAALKAHVMKPVTSAQLRTVFIASAVPFIGFGFLDNFLMILVGDIVDATLCVKFGFSTMAAAALGNTFSDVCGVFSGGVIEDMAQRQGLEMPPLDADQLRATPVKVYQYMGQAFGIVLGCFLGMCPLLWMDPEATEKKKREKTRIDVLNRVVTDVNDLLNAEATFMMMIDHDKKEMYTIATENIPEFRARLGEGVMGHCATTGKFINIKDIQQSEFFNKKRHTNYRDTGRDIKSVLCMPVMNLTDEKSTEPIVAVVEVINKKADTGFTTKDEEVLAAICSHITTALAEDQAKEFKNVIEMCRMQIVNREQYTTMNPVIEQRQMKLFETLMAETAGILRCEAAHLLLIDPVRQKLKTKVGHLLPLREFELNEDIIGKVCQRGQLVNIPDFPRSKYYDPAKHDNFLGTGIDIRTRLCVPVINTERHVIGCMEVINKKSNEVFNTDDIEQLLNIAGHVALTLEGQGSSIRKVLALAAEQRQMVQESRDYKRTVTRQQSGPLMVQIEPDEDEKNEDEIGEEDMWDDDVAASEDVAQMAGIAFHPVAQQSSRLQSTRAVFGGSQRMPTTASAVPDETTLLHQHTHAARQRLVKMQQESQLFIQLDKATDLPKADLFGTIDPYITVSIVEGDPNAPDYEGPTTGRGYTSALGWAKSSPIRQNQFPVWRERLPIDLPLEVVDNYENLYIHVKLWDWDFMKSDDMIGEVIYPLCRVLQEDEMPVKAFPLQPMKQAPDEYDLRKSRIYLKFGIARKKKKEQPTDPSLDAKNPQVVASHRTMESGWS